MTFTEAKNFRLPFTKHKGRTLDEVASTPQGLLFLDWLVGQSFVGSHTAEHLRVYLADPAIAAEVAKLVNRER